VAEPRLVVDLGAGWDGDAATVLREGDGALEALVEHELALRPDLRVVVAIRQRRLLRPAAWVLLRALRRSAGRSIRVYSANRLESPVAAVVGGALRLCPPLLSALIVLRLPIYAYAQVWRQLVRGGDAGVVGHGAGRGTGGLVFWLDYARRANRCGERGLADDEYFGVPLSVHCWPLALTVIRRLGFRSLLGGTGLLVLGGTALVPSPLAAQWALLLAAATLLSTWAMLSVYSGTWEPLAWGFAFVAMAAALRGEPVAAGVALGLTALTHPGVAAIAAIAATLSALEELGIAGLVLMGGLALVTCSPFAVAYLRSGRFLRRGENLKHFELRWSPASAYQLMGWLAFMAVALATEHGHTVGQAILLAVPALVLYTNSKLYWLFSQYTVVSFMLVVGLQELLLRPGWPSVITFALVSNPVPRYLGIATPDFLRGFDLTPIRLTDVRERLGSSLWPANGGITGFEAGGVPSEESYAAAALGYLLAEDGQAVFNSGYAEIGSSLLHNACTRFLARGTNHERFRQATIDAGVTTFVVFTPAFARQVHDWGARLRVVVPGVSLSPHFDAPPTDLHVLDLPWSSSRWSRLPVREREPNRIVIEARAGERHVLPLTAFSGWRARQAGEELPIESDPLGLAITAPAAGEIELRYRYRHYFRR
jgi:hypothetical protein